MVEWSGLERHLRCYSKTYMCWVVSLTAATADKIQRRPPSESNHERPNRGACTRPQTTRYQNTGRRLTRSVHCHIRTGFVSPRRRTCSYINIHSVDTFRLKVTSLVQHQLNSRWLGGLLVERRTSVSQIRGSIPGQVAAV